MQVQHTPPRAELKLVLTKTMSSLLTKMTKVQIRLSLS